MTLDMSDKELAVKNPFLEVPMANEKGFFPSLVEAYDIGRQGVSLDRQFADVADSVLASDADADTQTLDNLFKAKQELGKKEYYNQGGNVFSSAFLQGSQMAGPMVEGSIEGAKTAGAYGTAGFAVLS